MSTPNQQEPEDPPWLGLVYLFVVLPLCGLLIFGVIKFIKWAWYF